MARINRRPSANRRSVMPEEAPQQFNPDFTDIGEGDAWGPDPMGEPYLAPDPALGHDPMSMGPPPFMGSGFGSSPGFGSPPPSMGSPSIPAGAAGIKTPTMKMPSGGGYFSGGYTGSLDPDPMTSGATHVPSAEEEAAKWDFELPEWTLSGVSPTSEGEWKEGSYTYRPKMARWAETMGMTPEMWTKGGEGLIPYDPRYTDGSGGGLGIGGSHLPIRATDPEYHAMGTPDPFYYVRPGGKERLAETGKWRDFSRGGEWRPGYVGGRGAKKEKWFTAPVTEFTPSWLKPGMTSWPGMPE